MSLRAVVVCLILSGCTHKAFQFRPDGAALDVQRRRADLVLARLEAGDTAALKPLTDARGRTALLVLAASLAYEKSPEVRELVAAVIITAVLFALIDPPDERLEDWLGSLAALAQHRLVSDVVSLIGHDPSAPLSGQLRVDHTLELEQQPAVSACAFIGPVASYDLWLLPRLDWERAERSRTLRAWKEDVRQLHLVEARCGDLHGLLLFTSYDEPQAPFLVAVRFFTPDQWTRLRPKLDRALELGPR